MMMVAKAVALGAVLCLDHGKEDRRIADRVNRREIDFEGCDETLERGSSVYSYAVLCPYPNR